jgi:acyl carrier protein
MYGPTEATIISAVLEIDRRKVDTYSNLSSVPIGIPAANNNLLVLDEHMHLCPIGVSGELYIAGDALARGYLNNPELTAERFPESGVGAGLAPARELSTADGQPQGLPLQFIDAQRLYRTGDIGRRLPDGNIEFVDRDDQQVKIRGFRIEPGEIENRLRSLPAIKEAVVIDRETETGDKYLCAYIVGDPGDKTQLRDHLSRTLPAYMIPAYFVQLEKIPLNPNGKVDRKSCPLPGPETGKTYAAPTDEVEEKMAAIWSATLGVEKEAVGIDDNFFELGGHSLKATILAAKIHEYFKIKIPLADIFKMPTIREIASLIKTVQLASSQTVETSLESEEVII